MSDTVRNGVPATAAKYAAAVRKLGMPISGELRAEMRITGATGDLNLTVAAILKVLGDYETHLCLPLRV